MNISTLICNFKINLLNEGLREETVKAYYFEIDKFKDFTYRNNFSIDDLYLYRNNILSKVYARTANRAISVLNKFIIFINNVYGKNYNKIPCFSQIIKHNNCSVDISQMSYILNRIKKKEKSFGTQERDYLIVELMFLSGIRAGELVRLKIKDLIETEEGGQIFIRDGKGGKSRFVIVDKILFNKIKYFYSSTINIDVDIDDYLFHSNKGGRLTIRGLQHMLKKYNITPNVLRHSYATTLLSEHFKCIKEVMGQMGHISAETTKMYVDV